MAFWLEYRQGMSSYSHPCSFSKQQSFTIRKPSSLTCGIASVRRLRPCGHKIPYCCLPWSLGRVSATQCGRAPLSGRLTYHCLGEPLTSPTELIRRRVHRISGQPKPLSFIRSPCRQSELCGITFRFRCYPPLWAGYPRVTPTRSATLFPVECKSTQYERKRSIACN